MVAVANDIESRLNERIRRALHESGYYEIQQISFRCHEGLVVSERASELVLPEANRPDHRSSYRRRHGSRQPVDGGLANEKVTLRYRIANDKRPRRVSASVVRNGSGNPGHVPQVSRRPHGDH